MVGLLNIYTNEEDSILEIGCGISEFNKRINVKEYVGIDTSKELLKHTN